MQKSVLVYWSGAGNTQEMAEHIAVGVQAAGAEVDVFNVSDTTAKDVAGYDSILLGCPAMGAEVLEEGEFEPFFTELEPHLSGKKLALFGSYGWGDGEWMREWEKRAADAGAALFEQGLILNEAPDTKGIADCEAFGRRFAEG
jgi:flavodoxin short chain